MSELSCQYPIWSDQVLCGRGNVVIKGRTLDFCSKHYKTPFYTKREVNAYRRGLRDAKKASPHA